MDTIKKGTLERGKKNKSGLTVKQRKFLSLYKDLGCNIAGACTAMKIVRQTYYNWKANNKEFANEVEEAKEGIIDYVESKLMAKIAAGHERSIIFYLKTRAKHRGYVETSEYRYKRQNSNRGDQTFQKILEDYRKQNALNQ